MLRGIKLIGVVIIGISSYANAQGHSKTSQNWQLTTHETIWTARYDNCEYGYFSLLPEGVVAHAEHPPNPHHGFLINSADLGSKDFMSAYDSNRFVWVNAKYNATDAFTLADISDFEIDVAKADKKNPTLVERHRSKLQSVPATRFRIAYASMEGQMAQEEIVALRSGIIYTLGLRTPVEHYAQDREKMEQALSGFRFYRKPLECSER